MQSPKEIEGHFFGLSRHRMGTDGQGITTLCTFHGCPLRCRYCLNPKGLAPDTVCQIHTPLSLYENIRIDELYFLATGGGVTFGGGEPLLNVNFIEEFRSLCGSSWHLCAETSLYVTKEAIQKAATVIDEFIVDIKDTNAEIYLRYTQRPIDPMIENLKLLKELVSADHIVIRVPLIAGYNTDSDRQKSKQYLTELGFHRFDLFEYIIKNNG